MNANATVKENSAMKTTNVKTSAGTVKAYADSTGIVRVYDSVAGHYTVCHSLTANQERYVRARTMPR
jgi:hypothetical protein